VSQILKVILSYTCIPESIHRWRFSKARAQDVWRFSRFITISTILTLAIGQFDKVIIAKLFPLDILGLYVIASNFAAMPRLLADAYGTRVLFSVYSETNRLRAYDLKRAYYSQKQNPNLLYNFSVGGLISLSPAIVMVLYTARYSLVATYMQIMMISTLFVMSTNAANEVMIARGESPFTLSTNFVRVIFIVGFAPTAYFFVGVIGIVWSIGLMELAVQIYSWIVLKRRGLLDLRSEAVLLLAAAMGILLGYAVNRESVALLSGTFFRG
jgi:O-antigen/teichoic acid export membrane protein